EICLARATRAAGREPRDRQPVGERGRDPRLLAADRQYRPAELRVRAALRSTALRPEAGEAAPRRGRLSGRLRRGRLPPLPALLLDGRGAGRLSPGRRDPDADQDDGARGLPDRVAGDEYGVHRRLRLLRAVRSAHPPNAMRRFILRRLGFAVVSLFLLSVTIFFFVRVTGDPAVLLVEPGASQADLDAIRQQFGLDQP